MPTAQRKLLATLAAIALTLTGALAFAAPAQAAVDTLVVTSPLPDSATSSRTFDITGTGTDGGIIGVTSGATLLGTTIVGTDSPGAWSVTVSFPDTAPTAQDITVAQADLSDLVDPAAGEVTFSITLPDAAPAEPAGPIVVDEPADGAELARRTVPFTGTAPIGSFVTASITGQVVASTTIAADGGFAFTLPLPFELGDTVTVTFAGTDAEGVALVPVDVTIDLPAAIAAPVITVPGSGSTSRGTLVTFSGTGIAGTNIALAILPGDEATATALSALDPAAFTTPITVGDDGSWTVTYSLVLGSFSVTAFHTAAVIDGEPAEVLSAASNQVAFVLAAPVPPVVDRPGVLAATGATAGPGGALTGAGLLGAGLLLVLVGRRRTALR